MLFHSPQSSSYSSMTSIGAGCSKDYTPAHSSSVLTPNHLCQGKKVGFYRTGIRENHGFFIDVKEDKREKEAIRHGHHDPQQAQYQQEGYLSSKSSTLARSNDTLVLDPASSSFTVGLKRLHECMARTTESRQLLVRAHTLSSKDMAKLCATTRKVLTGGIDLHRIVLAGHQDHPISSNRSATSSLVVRRPQSSHESKSTTPSLSTIKRQRRVMQKKQARRAMKEHKRATISRTGVVFRPCMTGMLDS